MKHLASYPVYLLVCLTYFFLPNQNANIDSWFYAACVKHSEQLFQSHHLLYNYIGLGFYKLIQLFFPNIEAIQSLFILNATAATIILIVLGRLFITIGNSKEVSFALTAVCATCFGFYRFATDAETYIIPICFSILSTYSLLKSKQTKYTVLSAFFSVLAVLTHQVQIWWTLALLLHVILDKQRNTFSKTLFSLTLALIPLTYLGFYLGFNNHGSLIQFIGGEYSKGNAGLEFSLLSLGLTAINLIRSFIQIHGYLILLPNEFPVLITVLALILLFLSIKIIRSFKFDWGKNTDTDNHSRLFLVAFSAQFIFASLSSGNAEFMVMLPMLILLFLGSRYQIKESKPIMYVAIFLYTWNLSLGILPFHFLNFNSTKVQQKWTTEHPQEYYSWREKPLVENRLNYQYGFHKNFKFVPSDSIATLLERGESVIVDELKASGTIDRKTITGTGSFNTPENCKKEILDSFETVHGKNYIYRISKP